MTVLDRRKVKAQPETVDRYLYWCVLQLMKRKEAGIIRKFFHNMDLKSFFHIVNKLKYIPDAEGIEEIRAPWIVLTQNGGDCDDVAILTAFYCIANRLKFCQIQQGVGRAIKHVYTKLIDKQGDLYAVDPFGSVDFRDMFVGHWRS